MNRSYDALLLVSFGGPEGPDEVLPFLENVLRGKNVPRARMLEVAKHYDRFGGVSPINGQNRAFRDAIEADFADAGLDLPVYWGNRNWHPLLAETLQQMANDGVRQALAFITSAFSSYSGCRQYREDIERARRQVGDAAPSVEKLRVFFNHPGFLEPMVANSRAAFKELGDACGSSSLLMFSAHSLPLSMAENCDYEQQLRESCRIVADELGQDRWELVFQSRSGPPHQPWLGPDICDAIRAHHASGLLPSVVVVPIGFVSDHMEVLFDLDIEAKELCEQLGVAFARAETVGTHPRFVRMVRELVLERCEESPEKRALGTMSASHDVCPEDCCRYAPHR